MSAGMTIPPAHAEVQAAWTVERARLLAWQPRPGSEARVAAYCAAVEAAEASGRPTIPGWARNARLGLRFSLEQSPRNWDGYLAWLDFAAGHVDDYIANHRIKGNRLATAIVRGYVQACRRLAAFEKLQQVPERPATIVAAYKRARGVLA